MRAIRISAGALRSVSRHSPIEVSVRLSSRPFGKTIWLSSFVVVVAVWQIVLQLALLGGLVELGTYGGIHLFGCSVIAGYLIQRLLTAASDNRYSVALQVVAWSTIGGPFGSFVAAALALPAVFNDAKPEGEHGVPPDLFATGDSEQMHNALLDGHLDLQKARSTRPLLDVIVGGSQLEKLEALHIVYRRYEARLNVVLKRASSDHDTSVRVLAASVTARLHSSYGRKIANCQAIASARPGDAQAWRDLAAARLVYGESGLLETERVHAQEVLAACDLSHAVELDPADRPSVDRLEEVSQRLAQEDNG